MARCKRGLKTEGDVGFFFRPSSGFILLFCTTSHSSGCPNTMSAHQQQLRGPSFPSQQQQQQQHKINANGDNQPQHAQEHKPATANASTKKRKASPAPSSTDRRRMSTGIYPSTDDDAASTSSKPVREPKRTRVHFSCVECHRRKQKCDRKEPCSQCVARRVPHLCRPFLNGVEDPNM